MMGKRITKLLCVASLILLAGCANKSVDYSDEVAGLEALPLGAEGRVLKMSHYTPEEVKDIQYALNTRGLYWTAGQTPAYLNSEQCPINVYAHRGHYNYPENSLTSVLMGALGGFDGVEIDVMMTRDGYWVVHHDSISGRATGRRDGKNLRISRVKGKDWNTLVVRDKDGNLTNERAPYAIDVFEQWAKTRLPGQQLNIEIKEDADLVELAQLNRMVVSVLPQGSYFYSSLEFKVLKSMREVNSSVYLGYVWEPDAKSINEVKKVARRAAKSDVLYQKYSRSINWVSDYESRKRSRSKSNKHSAQTVRNALGANSGLHVDIRSFVKASTIYTRSKAAGLARVATYSINGTEYHQSQLQGLSRAGRSLPDEVIMDTSKFEFCHRLYPELVSKSSLYQPTTAYGRAIMQLPKDADFTRLDQQRMYLADNHYLTASGKVRLLNSYGLSNASTSPETKKTTSQRPAGSMVLIPEDEVFEIEQTSITLEIPN